jgi:hypothetical protein
MLIEKKIQYIEMLKIFIMKKLVVLIAVSFLSFNSFSQFSNSWFSLDENTTDVWGNFQTTTHYDNYRKQCNTETYFANDNTSNSYYEDDDYIDDYECYPMEGRKFRYALRSIERKSFSDTQLRLAKQIADTNCLTVRQIKRIANVFSFESTKLDFVKYSYNSCYDPENYWMVNDVFSFSSSTDELDDFLYGM